METIDRLIEGAVPAPAALHGWDEAATVVGNLLRDLGVDTDDFGKLRAIVAALVLNDVWTENESVRLVHIVALLAHGARRTNELQSLP